MTTGPVDVARAPHGERAERTLMRIYVGESDRHDGMPTYEAVVRLLRGSGLAGATVTRAAAGFGATRAIHSTVSEIGALDLPVLIECVDTEERIRDILPALDGIVAGGLMTIERAEVIMYRADRSRDARKERA